MESSQKNFKEVCKMIVIDDDPLFLAQMKRYALENGIIMTACKDYNDVWNLSPNDTFDVCILDFNLGNDENGIDLSEQFDGLPVVLVSNTSECTRNSGNWPSAIRAYINKRQGVRKIGEAALNVAGWN